MTDQGPNSVFINDAEIDISHAVEIAPRIWWVGHVQKNDPFQCHVYLIEQGDQSVLIDPGSVLTIENTLAKIEEVIPFTSIRYFICQHQDPDIIGAMPELEKLIRRNDAMMVTHWRTKMIVKHYGIQLPYYLIDENEWHLALEDRTLQFCFTPYAHFPGAFTTFDAKSQIMFSSDIFGGLTDEFSLVAKDEGYLECMKPFHQHYMPSNDIMQFVLTEIEKFPMKMIAPQHGSIIPEHLINFMIDGLKSLDCGLYLLLSGTTDFRQLAAFNDTLKKITHTMTMYRDFKQIAVHLLEIVRSEVAVESLEFFVRDLDEKILLLSEKNQFRGKHVEPPEMVRARFDGCGSDNGGEACNEIIENEAGRMLLVPLLLPEKVVVEAVVLMHLETGEIDQERLERIVDQMRVPLQVAIEREMVYRDMDHERDRIYQRAIRDPLTGLYTRIYMADFVQKLIEQHERTGEQSLAALMLDIDHFKSVNDTYGHNQGDIVLKRVAECVIEHCRAADIPVRLGGEEFIVFSQNSNIDELCQFAERIREAIEAMVWDEPMQDRKLTASFGTACRQTGENLTEFIERVDAALYRAKESGRNRVCS